MNQLRNILCSWAGEFAVIMMSSLPKLIYTVNGILVPKTWALEFRDGRTVMRGTLASLLEPRWTGCCNLHQMVNLANLTVLQNKFMPCNYLWLRKALTWLPLSLTSSSMLHSPNPSVKAQSQIIRTIFAWISLAYMNYT